MLSYSCSVCDPQSSEPRSHIHTSQLLPWSVENRLVRRGRCDTAADCSQPSNAAASSMQSNGTPRLACTVLVVCGNQTETCTAHCVLVARIRCLFRCFFRPLSAVVNCWNDDGGGGGASFSQTSQVRCFTHLCFGNKTGENIHRKIRVTKSSCFEVRVLLSTFLCVLSFLRFLVWWLTLRSTVRSLTWILASVGQAYFHFSNLFSLM